MATDAEQAAAAARPRIAAYAWYALFVLVLVYIINFIDRQIISILAQDIKRESSATSSSKMRRSASCTGRPSPFSTPSSESPSVASPTAGTGAG
jgi:hypothetical protein